MRPIISGSGLALAAAAAMLAIDAPRIDLSRPAPSFPPLYPFEGNRRKARRSRWNNEGVRANKQFRLKGVRP